MQVTVFAFWMVIIAGTVKAQHNRSMPTSNALIDSAHTWLYDDQQKAINFAQQALDDARKHNRYSDQAGAYNVMGNAYHLRGEFTRAFDCYNSALQISLANKLPRNAVSSYVNLGYVHADQDNYELARKNYKLGIAELMRIKRTDTLLRSDSSNLSNLYNNLGVIFFDEGKPDSALVYYFVALRIRQKLGIQHNIAGSLSNIGGVYHEKKEFKKSMQYHLQALSIDSVNTAPIVYSNLSSSYYHERNYSKALYYANKALAAGQSGMEQYVLVELYMNLFRAHARQDHIDSAIHYGQLALALKDTISRGETKRIVSEAVEKYESEQKELKIQQQDAELQRQSTQKIAFGVGFAFLLVFFIIVYRGYRQKQRANREILHQKLLVEEKQKEIIDSISYAKKIQDAYLPTIDVFHQVFPQAFLLFKPKDLVSGDFYWFYTIPEGSGACSNTVMLAVADCTGHGVPGALMSMVCSNALNEVVVQRKIYDPGQVLDEARRIIIRSLKSEAGSEQKDGMDIALCRFNKETGELWFAGANNPLWIISPGNGEAYTLNALKPNKEPVGIFDRQSPFTTQQVQLQQGDSLYLFSDGYADQFGGEKGKKFKYAALQQLLLQHAGQPMQQQGEILAREFEAWQGDHEQVDDVCVMGIKL